MNRAGFTSVYRAPFGWIGGPVAGPADYPAELHDRINFQSWVGTPLVESQPSHTAVHQKLENEVLAIQYKLGLGALLPAAAGMVLICTGEGVTEWMTLADAISAYGS